MINAKEFIKALDAFEKEKGISKELVLVALKEAMEKGFIKQLGQTDDMPEARVRVDIDAKKGTIRMVNIKTVVATEDDVQDDFLEISVEGTQDKELNPEGIKYQPGDDFEIDVPTDEIKKLTAQNIKSVLKQKIAECEKSAIFEAYKDKKGEIINGIVEKVDEHSCMINIGRTTVCLPYKQKIRDESFKVGDSVRVYIVDVAQSSKGAQIQISRTDPGFLKRLFEEEIHEIYEGIVVIKSVAREAGDRSKIAVFSVDPNVDPIGSCIGQGGQRVQNICKNLGDVKEKEKIDIVAYNENPLLFIAEALKPADVLGISVVNDDMNARKAIAIVKNGDLSLAIGKKGVNARLAVKLTGWDIDIKELDAAMGEGIQYKRIDEIKAEVEAEKRAGAYVEVAQVEPEAVEEEVIEEENDEFEQPAEEATYEAEEEAEVEQPAEEVKPVEAPKPQPAPTTVKVKSNVSIESLEKGLEEEKKRLDRQANYANRKRNFKKNNGEDEETEEVEEIKKPVDRSSYMSIYSEEELARMDEEEEEETSKYDEDIDYDEFDSYYDDND